MLLTYLHPHVHLPRRKKGETWELSEIGEYEVEKYLRFVLVLSVKFGPTNGCNNRTKQWDARNLTMNTVSFRILNCEAEARSDFHCPRVAIADFWVKQKQKHKNKHTKPQQHYTQNKHTHTTHTHKYTHIYKHTHTHSTFYAPASSDI
jgi:hypothetical protein